MARVRTAAPLRAPGPVERSQRVPTVNWHVTWMRDLGRFAPNKEVGGNGTQCPGRRRYIFRNQSAKREPLLCRIDSLQTGLPQLSRVELCRHCGGGRSRGGESLIEIGLGLVGLGAGPHNGRSDGERTQRDRGGSEDDEPAGHLRLPATEDSLHWSRVEHKRFNPRPAREQNRGKDKPSPNVGSKARGAGEDHAVL